ncbi:hypothetical protein HK099_007750 [Clydaea vesicula]|uniref:Transmembrane protein n=1 Tax=Clydaea vesicula TaxID=447962 RepID=A0AAD5TWS2_9FUNG|nr:hypothetical protein HK099_007750 [Clydaea vesicula]KAJ3397178.1 hypothetical protein HDU92_000483 [Lobulomyces angularis]
MVTKGSDFNNQLDLKLVILNSIVLFFDTIVFFMIIFNNFYASAWIMWNFFIHLSYYICTIIFFLFSLLNAINVAKNHVRLPPATSQTIVNFDGTTSTFTDITPIPEPLTLTMEQLLSLILVPFVPMVLDLIIIIVLMVYRKKLIRDNKPEVEKRQKEGNYSFFV